MPSGMRLQPWDPDPKPALVDEGPSGIVAALLVAALSGAFIGGIVGFLLGAWLG